MCPEQDSNLHVVKHTHLKRARLPIPPPGQVVKACAYVLFRMSRAANETRTRDPDLGKVVLYQLSYCRIVPNFVRSISLNAVAKVRLFFKPANFSALFFQKNICPLFSTLLYIANPCDFYSQRNHIHAKSQNRHWNEQVQLQDERYH